jgi:hypothetical protein
VSAQDELRTALKDILGPAARRHRYAGSAPTWRKSNAEGDWVVVNVQSSSSSAADRLRCVVNLAAMPEQWLRWQREILGPGMPASISESLGLYRDRLHPADGTSGGDDWWEITEKNSAQLAVSEMVRQLESEGWPLLEDWLTHEGLAKRIGEGSFGFFQANDRKTAMAQALLLMDAGPSAALDGWLEQCIESSTYVQKVDAERFKDWALTQSLADRNIPSP